MTGELRYVTFNTSMGWMALLGSITGLLRSTLPHRSAEEASQLLGNSIDYAAWSPHLFADLIVRLQRYLAGHRVTFPDELNLSRATAFQRQVWEATRLIPYGETRSYGWVAGRVGKPGAARAVGQALTRNPLPVIIPCHRVVAGNGEPGGYRGGVGLKGYLLFLEASAKGR